MALLFVLLSLAASAQSLGPSRSPPKAATGIAATPPLGFNTWTSFGCSGINATVVESTADLMVGLGLRDAGYQYVNMDDCWMLPTANRSDHGKGPQVPNPTKFPHGMAPVADYVHNKSLKFGVYTARGDHTCQGFAASCEHEMVDAAQYAAWGVDYIKDDSCSSCRPGGAIADYQAMAEAVVATGRRIVLSIEGQPDVPTCSRGGHGNLRRVGHDISARWYSVLSELDVASGLWPYAHNATSPAGDGNGWFNDMDMVQVGQGEFAASTAEGLDAARAHLSMWAMVKSPILIGTDLRKLTPADVAVLTNREALAIHQDPLGHQARRVSSTPGRPSNGTAPAVCVRGRTARQGATAPCDNQAVFAPCEQPTPSLQTWRYNATRGQGPPNLLFVAPCNASDPHQLWDGGFASSSGGSLRNRGTLQCAVGSPSDPVALGPCSAGDPKQAWLLSHAAPEPASSGHISSAAGRHCLDVDDFVGPDVEYGSCKAPGAGDSNQLFAYNASSGLLHSLSAPHGAGAAPDRCLVAGYGPPGGRVFTVDSGGVEWCLYSDGHIQGAMSAVLCDQLTPRQGGAIFLAEPRSGGILELAGADGRALTYDNQTGASGPLPHARYSVMSGGTLEWNFSLPSGGPIRPRPGQEVADDDNVGHVGLIDSGELCLTLAPAGNLEVWAVQLSGSRVGVALFNRTPYAQPITAHWADLGLAPSAAMAVRDVWRARDAGTSTASYTDPSVPARGVVLLTLTPASHL